MTQLGLLTFIGLICLIGQINLSFGLFYITGLTFGLSLSNYLNILSKGALAYLNHYHSFCPASYVLIVYVHFSPKWVGGIQEVTHYGKDIHLWHISHTYHLLVQSLFR